MTLSRLLSARIAFAAEFTNISKLGRFCIYDLFSGCRSPPFPPIQENRKWRWKRIDKEYYININGQRIPVTEEVYYAFKRPAWRERKRRQVRSGKELSLEALADAGFEVSSEQEVTEFVEGKLLSDMLAEALLELTCEERFLIYELFYNDKSERKIAAETGLSKTGVHKRKQRILDKLRKILENR